MTIASGVQPSIVGDHLNEGLDFVFLVLFYDQSLFDNLEKGLHYKANQKYIDYTLYKVVAYFILETTLNPLTCKTIQNSRPQIIARKGSSF